MPRHSIERILPHTPDQLFELVSDIESYPTFLPWCEAARIIEEEKEDVILADMLIHFKGVSGKYTSRVFLDKEQQEISVELAQGPFEHLYQGWKFIATAKGTRVEFDIDFKLRSFILEKVMNMMFDTACEKMMSAFEARALKLFG